MATLGKTNIGSSGAVEIQKWWSIKFTAGATGGTITDMNVYADGLISIGFKLCIWADSSGSPGSLLAESSIGTMTTTPGWWTRSLSYTFSPSQVMHFGIVAEDWMHVYRDAGSTNQFTEFTQDYTNWSTTPNPPTVDGQYDYENSIYVNYTTGNTTNFFF